MINCRILAEREDPAAKTGRDPAAKTGRDPAVKTGRDPAVKAGRGPWTNRLRNIDLLQQRDHDDG